MDDVTKWRLRERGLFLGMILWAVGLAALVAFAKPVLVAHLSGSPLAIVGKVLLTAGLAGGVGHGIVLGAHYWATPSDPDLTEVRLDE